MENNTEMLAISKSIDEIGKKLESDYLSKSEYKHEATKLAEAVSALSKEMDRKRLEDKSHPMFGSMAVAQDMVNCMKSAMAQSEPSVQKYATDSTSPWFVGKDLNAYGTNTGAEVVPTTVSSIFSYLLAQGGIARKNSTLLTGVQGNVTLTKRSGTSTAAFTASAGTLEEDAAVTPSVFGTAKVTLSPAQISAISLVSDKLLYCSAVNIAEMVSVDLIEQALVLEDNSAIKGDGTSTYGGSYGYQYNAGQGGYVPVKTVAASAFTNLDPIMALPGLVHESVYGSPNAKYYISGPVIQAIRAFKASTAGLYFIPTGDKGFTLNGYDVEVWHRMDNTIAAGKFPVMFGDLRKASTIGVGRDMQLLVSRDYKFGTNQLAFRLSYDWHQVLVQPSALALCSVTS